ncbi:hypothetical protein TPHA_0B00230 [Tetrapisispora phaffii CBS 4417]|uniref:Histone-lysine N-methyltransferase SET5 n=1 Tax=Tetrapisispora phaffii (strain ATCC 24235 / CBS 4417 / NBRC 1672 / NRRL Y-8282 / UCD 70-5) TaxID=1071381 RepID=G8BQ98_TETPH|nr:hypothetical protein TPHA_0B00230 [Tetrapisispora phaffii CBS 4417]CCE61695.1 hypothetical protein TPHA_0B00230 [Tetrapisispora phaffii CBS 4417]
MTLKFKTLSLNDSDVYVPNTFIIPSETEMIDEIKRIWDDDNKLSKGNSTQNLIMKELNRRQPEWKIDIFTFHHVMVILNIRADSIKNNNGDNTDPIGEQDLLLKSYNDLIVKPDKNMYDSLNSNDAKDNCFVTDCKDVLSKGRGLFAKKNFKKDELIFKEEPIVIVPPIERLNLIEAGKACALCGRLMNEISEQFIIKNGLDCESCINTVWCSKQCLKRDFTHKYLKHPFKSSTKLKVNSKKWKNFEKCCKESVFIEGYIIGHIYAASMIDHKNEFDIKKKFDYLAYISQKDRYQGNNLTNFEKSLEDTNDSISDEHPSEIWEKSFNYFKEAFPESDIDYEEYLNYIGRYNLNHKSAQLYSIYSLVNHNCEPNVRVEVDYHTKELKLYARKSISKNSELLTTYINPLHDVELRRKILLINYGFACNCERCENEIDRIKSEIKETTDITTSPHVRLTVSHSDNIYGTTSQRRKSSMRAARPDFTELLKNGKEFDLEIPENISGKKSRSASVRFDNHVTLAVEEA